MSDKDPQWPGPDGKPGVSFAPKGSRKRNQAKPQQQKQSAPPAAPAQTKGDAAATTNLKQAPATTKLPVAKQDKEKSGPGKQGAPQQGHQGQKKQQGSQGKPAQQAPPKSPSSAPQSVKPEAAGGSAPAGGVPSAASLWATPTPTAAPLAPLPAPDGSAPSVQKPVKEGAGTKDGKSTETTKGGGRKTRKARLRLSRIDPWSVMKTSFLFSIAFGIILVVVTAVLWQVIESSGALDSVNSTMNQLIGDANTKFSIQDYINSGRVVGLVTLLAAVDVVILTAVATLFAFLYNLAATVLGGLEITLAED